MQCHHCQKNSEVGDRVGRRETCAHCGWDLHVCYNCQHYDKSSYNECRETQADRVLEKEKSNFCDYFSPSQGDKKPGKDSTLDAKAKLAALFKK
ncbi:MAG: hypothetical protein HYU97_02910 [Deltaproteobacteria bacterium]|nr:hypothetical protein [Deltaproteobacteria bacterium]